VEHVLKPDPYSHKDKVSVTDFDLIEIRLR